MTLTDAQRRVLVDLSDGEWRPVAMHHPANIVGHLRRAELIRSDFDHLAAHEKQYTITPDGLQALEASA